MKQLVVFVALFSLILSGIAFADEQKQGESTIVGPVMQNRYINHEDLPKPGETGDLSETSQKLMDQGVIQAAEQARTTQPVVQPVRKK